MESNTEVIHGRDVFLKEEDIVLGKRFVEACALESYVLFTEKTVTMDKKKTSVDLWLHNTNGNGLTQLTRSSESVSNPVLGVNLPGADNQALYLKSGQIWTIPLDGGESAQVTQFPTTVDTFKVFTGPGDIIYLALNECLPRKSPEETTAIDKERENEWMVWSSISFLCGTGTHGTVMKSATMFSSRNSMWRAAGFWSCVKRHRRRLLILCLVCTRIAPQSRSGGKGTMQSGQMARKLPSAVELSMMMGLRKRYGLDHRGGHLYCACTRHIR